MAYETILVEAEGGVGTLTLNRPAKKNAMNPTMHLEVADALEKIRYDDAIAILVVTGAGDAFSSGMDLKEYFIDLKSQPNEFDRINRVSIEWRGRTIRHFPKPTVAMVNGYCFGGALPIVESCDIAVAADEATFGLSEINFRSIPGGMVTKDIVDMLRPREGLYYALTGKTFDGKRAAEIGLVTLSVPKAQLMTEVYEHARLLKGKDAIALRHTKETFKHSAAMDRDDAYNFATAKAAEGNYQQGKDGNMYAEIGGFIKGEFKPGLGHKE